MNSKNIKQAQICIVDLCHKKWSGGNMKINSENVKDVLALSPMQESMLFFYLTSSEQEKYVAQICYRLTGKIQIDKFYKSWESVIEDNDILRTVFRWERLKQPIQIVLKKYTVDIQTFDCRERGVENVDSFIEDEMIKDRKERFDITKFSYRIKLYQFSEEEAYMLMSSFSIIYDGWSNSIMLKEFFTNYNQLIDGKMIQHQEKRQYKDYIKWLRAQPQEMYQEFWRNYLAGHKGKKDNFSQLQKKVGQCNSYQFILPNDIERKIKDYLAQTQVTLAALIYSMWALWYYKEESIDDVVFGVTVSGRPAELAGMESVMGVFINTIPLRIKINPSQSLSSLISDIHKNMIQIKRYETHAGHGKGDGKDGKSGRRNRRTGHD